MTIERDVMVDTTDGNLFLLRGVSDAGKLWIEDCIIETVETQHWHGAIVVESRYILNIIDGMRASGLHVSTNFPN